MLNSQLPLKERAKAAMHATAFYAKWYPKLWSSWEFKPKKDPAAQEKSAPAPEMDPAFAHHVRYARSASGKLARALFHAMAWHGPKLESKQILLGRFVDIGAELFAITATCSRAQLLLASHPDKAELIKLVDYFCRLSRLRIKSLFQALHHNADTKGYSIARKMLEGRYAWLTSGVVRIKHIPPV